MYKIYKYIYIYLKYTYIYIYLHISSPLHWAPAANIIFLFKEVSFSGMTGMPNSVCFCFKVALTALGPISACSASETRGK